MTLPESKRNKRDQLNTKYSEEDLNAAVLEIKKGGSLRAVARKYGIPSSTLGYRVSGKFIKPGKGPSPFMTKEEESELGDWIIECSTMRCPRQMGDIRKCANEIITRNDRITTLKRPKFGKTWFRNFLKRHPEVIGHYGQTVVKDDHIGSSSDSEEELQ